MSLFAVLGSFGSGNLQQHKPQRCDIDLRVYAVTTTTQLHSINYFHDNPRIKYAYQV